MADGGQKIGSCHARFSFRWNRSKMADTISSAGSMKWFSPKISRQMTPMCWCVLLCFFPLVNEDDEKKCCHTEINARQVERNDLTEDAAKNRTNHPITAAEQCNEEHGVLLFFLGEI